ncbi:MAG: hypothetical protein M1381_00535 [Deltaproteobacteria bacterium]|nr:hypothetical protein [Deltaproteobacteria bacterium]MCL5791510.1 hypothetical protein [Deltaproteobacteria bacterium]
MKKLFNLVTIGILAIGLAGMGMSCGSSSSSGSSTTGVSSSLSSLPNANLTVSNVGSVAAQVFDGVNAQPPSSVSSVVSSGPQLPVLSYMFSHLNNVVVKPQSMRGAVLNVLTNLKTLQTSGSSCSPTSIVNNSTGNNQSGTVYVTITWNSVPCTDPSTGTQMTINGSASVNGSYDGSSGTVSITTSLDVSAGENFTNGGSAQINFKGGESVNGSGIATTNITYTEKGSLNISGSVTNMPIDAGCGTTGTTTASGSFNGWMTIDDSFTGSPNSLASSKEDGNETDISGTLSNGSSETFKQGSYAKASITISSTSQTTRTINGSGTFGQIVTGTATSTCGTPVTNSASYSGKVSVGLRNITFNDAICSGQWPANGTLTITADRTFTVDFSVNSNGSNCGCANVSEGSGAAKLDCNL